VKRPAKDVFRHVKMRARARYGVELPRHVWDAWNANLDQWPIVEQRPDGTTVREVPFHGKVFRALCSRRVLTVLP
jgi:hypothetical protein